uniref:tRNA dimethylallyltransferase n=2 Tax=Oryza brachyantha TaxID=4533 RepID=J3L891_ORYBR
MAHLAASAAPHSNADPGAAEEASQSPAPTETGRRKVVVVMGATGAGKSRLAVDLAAHFAGVEVVSADSMQVYRGLDVLTNKIPLHEQNGVPHHLLSVIDSSVEFTCRDFRDHAVPIIEGIFDRGGLPVIVGGTNFYIQTLVSPFLFDDMTQDIEGCTFSEHLDEIGLDNDDEASLYEHLKIIDPVAAQRIHPNNHRKIKRYLELYESTGALPSDLFQGEATERWGRPSNSRFDCCFLWVDADLQVLDRYVSERVNCMIDDGLLDEVCNIYDREATYTQGLRQAIGVREFDELFRFYLTRKDTGEIKMDSCTTMAGIHDDNLKSLLDEAVSQLKANTRKLVRRQRRRLHRLNKDFEWNLHHVDATEAFNSATADSWNKKVVKPCVDIVRGFLSNDTTLASSDRSNVTGSSKMSSRELWIQYVCEACDNRVLRGAHEWEQHRQGRCHRKRVQRLKQKTRGEH